MKKITILSGVVIFAALLFSCNSDSSLSKEPMVPKSVILANQVEITMTAMKCVLVNVEDISSKIAKGELHDVTIHGDVKKPSGWSYVFKSDVLEGEAKVTTEGLIGTDSCVQKVDCSNLRFRYFLSGEIKLFGELTVKNISKTDNNAIREVASKSFGCSSVSRSPEVTINANYRIESVFDIKNFITDVAFSGTAKGFSEYINNYEQKITENIIQKANSFYFTKGKMEITAKTVSDNAPIYIEYSATGKIITNNGERYQTFYNN